MLWRLKPKPSAPTPDARDAQRRETVAQLQERIVSERGVLPPETLDATVRYIRENSDDYDGVLTLARAAAQTLNAEDYHTDSPRERILHEALSSQRDPERLDALTRALIHETTRVSRLPEVLVKYMETHPERHPWATTIRDYIVKDIPRAQREHAQHYGDYLEDPFIAATRVFREVKRVPALSHALRAYASVFDEFAIRPDLVGFAERLREDYPDDLPSASALLTMMVSNLRRGWQPDEVYSAFTRLHDRFGDELLEQVIHACDSFLLPLPSELALGMGEHGTRDAPAIVRRVAQWANGLRTDDSGYERIQHRSGYRFLRNFAQTPVGAAAYMALLVETPDAGERGKLFFNLKENTINIVQSRAAAASIAAGIVDMYRRGLIAPNSVVETESQLLLAMTLVEQGASFFVDDSAFQYIPGDAPNGSRPLMAYLATTPLGANGDYDSEASKRLIHQILERSEWIDAILSDFDRAVDPEEGKRIVNGWLLPALIAYPRHASHVVERLKERLKTAETLVDQATVVCAFGHLCDRLHARAFGDEWVLPRRLVLERRLREVRPAILGRAQQILHALDTQLDDIHNTHSLSPDALESLIELRDAVNRAVATMAASALNDLTDRFTPASMVADVVRNPAGSLENYALQREFAERAAQHFAARLCS